MTDKPIVPNAIAKIRKELGMSQDDLATKLSMSITQLSRLERGVSSLTQKRMREIADGLNVRPEELFQIAKQFGDVRLDVMHEVIRQLDELLIRFGVEVTPKERADFTIACYKKELERIDEQGLTVDQVDVEKYRDFIQSPVK